MPEKELLGALTIVGFSPVVPQSQEDEVSQFVLKCAMEISESFGYDPKKEANCRKK